MLQDGRYDGSAARCLSSGAFGNDVLCNAATMPIKAMSFNAAAAIAIEQKLLLLTEQATPTPDRHIAIRSTRGTYVVENAPLVCKHCT